MDPTGDNWRAAKWALSGITFAEILEFAIAPLEAVAGAMQRQETSWLARRYFESGAVPSHTALIG
jgi:hypothetical protein